MVTLKMWRRARNRTERLVRLATMPAYRAERRRRRTYDEIFRAVAGTVLVSVPQFEGSFEIESRSHILKRLLVEIAYEAEVVETVRRRIDPGRDAIDVGANIGLFTVLMSGLIASGQRVLAIEPTPGAIRLLRANIQRNQRNNVEVFEGAAGSGPGPLTINVIEGMEEYSSLAPIIHPSVDGVDAPALDRSGRDRGWPDAKVLFAARLPQNRCGGDRGRSSRR